MNENQKIPGSLPQPGQIFLKTTGRRFNSQTMSIIQPDDTSFKCDLNQLEKNANDRLAMVARDLKHNDKNL